MGKRSQAEEAALIVKAGGLVAYPTDTYYALGAGAANRIAILKVFGAKRRDMKNPISVAVYSIEKADELVFVNSAARKLAEKFFPGPLSIVLKKKARVPNELTGGLEKIAIRVPDNDLALEFLDVAGPVTATMANISGNENPLTIEEVKSQLGAKVDFFLDGGKCAGIEPTIIDLSNPDTPKIIKIGSISKDELMKALKA